MHTAHSNSTFRTVIILCMRIVFCWLVCSDVLYKVYALNKISYARFLCIAEMKKKTTSFTLKSSSSITDYTLREFENVIKSIHLLIFFLAKIKDVINRYKIWTSFKLNEYVFFSISHENNLNNKCTVRFAIFILPYLLPILCAHWTVFSFS